MRYEDKALSRRRWPSAAFPSYALRSYVLDAAVPRRWPSAAFPSYALRSYLLDAALPGVEI
jgi:hypothetical protein